MLNKTVIMDLLKNGEYAEIVEHFTVEYKLLLQSFLTKNNIETAEDDSMIDIIYKVESNFPQHDGLMKLISRMLYNEDLIMADRIEKMIDNYKIVKERLT